jgi:hypothetical protein
MIMARGGFKELKSMHRESEETHHVTGNGVYYMLTLDPSVKDHRVIALLIDYTSRRQECPFYETDNRASHCIIAPDFTIMWNDCQGRCFVKGLTCPIILDHTGKTDDQAKRET